MKNVSMTNVDIKILFFMPIRCYEGSIYFSKQSTATSIISFIILSLETDVSHQSQRDN